MFRVLKLQVSVTKCIGVHDQASDCQMYNEDDVIGHHSLTPRRLYFEDE